MRFTFSAVLVVACLLAGCGQKGPLFLPDWMRPPPSEALAFQHVLPGLGAHAGVSLSRAALDAPVLPSSTPSRHTSSNE